MSEDFQRELSLDASGYSAGIRIAYSDNIGIQLEWSGNPVGNFYVQVGLDNVSYVDLDVEAVAAGGSDGVWVYDLNQLSLTWIRIRYDKTSGTGAATIKLHGKKV